MVVVSVEEKVIVDGEVLSLGNVMGRTVLQMLSRDEELATQKVDATLFIIFVVVVIGCNVSGVSVWGVGSDGDACSRVKAEEGGGEGWGDSGVVIVVVS